MITMGRLKRKKTLFAMTGKQKMKHRNVTLRFTSITGMMWNMSKLRRTPEPKKRKLQNQKINNEEEIENNEEIFMVELQSEDNEKKAKVVGKADNEDQATKE